jgi:tetratricopeptide (TPR) repeat protein
MPPRRGCFVLAVCFVLVGRTAAAPEPAAPPPGLEAWEKGQQALLAGRTEQAIAAFEESLRQDPGLARNHLSLAAARLGRGEDEQAVLHLHRYLEAQPDHLVVRGQYAELLWRLERTEAAREQFERFAADLQEHEELARQHLVHCHSRLVEIARAAEDDYGLHLHRGIGLYWLACQRAALPDPEGELSCEGLLCQAAAELAQARLERPDEARPCWYLYGVWSRLAQKQPAARWLRAALAAAPFSDLTPAERRRLYLACRHFADTPRK